MHYAIAIRWSQLTDEEKRLFLIGKRSFSYFGPPPIPTVENPDPIVSYQNCWDPEKATHIWSGVGKGFIPKPF